MIKDRRPKKRGRGRKGERGRSKRNGDKERRDAVPAIGIPSQRKGEGVGFSKPTYRIPNTLHPATRNIFPILPNIFYHEISLQDLPP
jgi:hypothetical protein